MKLTLLFLYFLITVTSAENIFDDIEKDIDETVEAIADDIPIV